MQRRTVKIPNPQKLCKQRVTTLSCWASMLWRVSGQNCAHSFDSFALIRQCDAHSVAPIRQCRRCLRLAVRAPRGSLREIVKCLVSAGCPPVAVGNGGASSAACRWNVSPRRSTAWPTYYCTRNFYYCKQLQTGPRTLGPSLGVKVTKRRIAPGLRRAQT